MGIRSLAGIFHHEIGPLHLSEDEFIPDEPLLDDSEVVVEQNGTAPPVPLWKGDSQEVGVRGIEVAGTLTTYPECSPNGTVPNHNCHLFNAQSCG
ncbi:hypothetical protein TNCV_4360131 [Trichonephila clavipes]|uniref:Uncharacterized protein n=1 Tax=Trichonephila clavipes TaxID=2585209 RepID=A0A8X6WBK4_TRICX|nr:hypothetical protein TNCV_4360131 [Trichonephila clavipes]